MRTYDSGSFTKLFLAEICPNPYVGRVPPKIPVECLPTLSAFLLSTYLTPLSIRGDFWLTPGFWRIYDAYETRKVFSLMIRSRELERKFGRDKYSTHQDRLGSSVFSEMDWTVHTVAFGAKMHRTGIFWSIWIATLTAAQFQTANFAVFAL